MVKRLMGKRSSETEPRNRTRLDAGDAPAQPSGASRSTGTQAGINMDKDGNYTWTPAQERKGSGTRRVAALA